MVKFRGSLCPLGNINVYNEMYLVTISMNKWELMLDKKKSWHHQSFYSSSSEQH